MFFKNVYFFFAVSERTDVLLKHLNGTNINTHTLKGYSGIFDIGPHF